MLDGKLFEWAFNGGTFWLAVETFMRPESLTNGPFHRLTDFMHPVVVVIFSAIISIIGISALIYNGRSLIVGPMIRSVCAIGRAFLWSQFAYALYLLDPVNGNATQPSAGFEFWVVFTCAELYVAYRAMADVQRAV